MHHHDCLWWTRCFLYALRIVPYANSSIHDLLQEFIACLEFLLINQLCRISAKKKSRGLMYGEWEVSPKSPPQRIQLYPQQWFKHYVICWLKWGGVPSYFSHKLNLDLKGTGWEGGCGFHNFIMVKHMQIIERNCYTDDKIIKLNRFIQSENFLAFAQYSAIVLYQTSVNITFFIPITKVITSNTEALCIMSFHIIMVCQ
jgi:hypothetical protein